LHDNPPDVLLLDLRLPILSGAELADALAGDEVLSTVPVVVLTSGSESDDFSRLEEINLEGYLRKPISKRELYKLLSKLLPARASPPAAPAPELEAEGAAGALVDALPETSPASAAGLQKAAEGLGDLLAERLERLERAPDIDEIERFGRRVREIGAASGVEEVSAWGQEFLSAAETFDVQRINDMLGGMRQFYERLRSASSKALPEVPSQTSPTE
jgi:hypothetical protein